MCFAQNCGGREEGAEGGERAGRLEVGTTNGKWTIPLQTSLILGRFATPCLPPPYLACHHLHVHFLRTLFGILLFEEDTRVISPYSVLVGVSWLAF